MLLLRNIFFYLLSLYLQRVMEHKITVGVSFEHYFYLDLSHRLFLSLKEPTSVFKDTYKVVFWSLAIQNL